MELENRTDELEHVAVTGASGHLGGTVVDTFLETGCRVTGLDLDVDSEEVVADGERDGLFWRHLDAADPDSVAAAVDDVESEVAGIDALVHCAGGFRWTPMDEADDETIDFLVEANLRSALYTVREVLPSMKERGWGRIVLMSSKSTLGPSEGEGPYTSTKAGLNALTKSVADEVRELDVNINALLPSVIDTPTNRDDMPDADFDKWVGREQLAEIIFRLTQSFGDPINGALLPVTGRM